MKKTLVARAAAAKLHSAEAAVAVAIEEVKAGLATMVSAKAELEMTTPVADAAIQHWAESLALLEQAQAGMIDGHKDAYDALQLTHIRGVASTLWPLVNGGEDESIAA